MLGACVGQVHLLTAVARKFARCKLGLVRIQEVGWDKGRTVRAGDNYFFPMEKERENQKLRTIFFVHHRTISAVKKVEFF
jgi:hypothetical protein